jgi:hypothetical protein
MLHVVCIKAGPKFGPDYPNILFDMVRRSLAEGYPGTFTCFTDDASGLDEGIEVRPLPADLPGWWSKLALFKPGLFPEGDRVLSSSTSIRSSPAASMRCAITTARSPS